MKPASSTTKSQSFPARAETGAENKPPSFDVEEFLRVVIPDRFLVHNSNDANTILGRALSAPLVQKVLEKLHPIQRSLECPLQSIYMSNRQFNCVSYGSNYDSAMPTPTCKDLLLFEVSPDRQQPKLVNSIQLQQYQYAPVSIDGDYAVCRALICKFKCKSDSQVQLEAEKHDAAAKLAELQVALQSNQSAVERSKQLAREARSGKTDGTPPVELRDIGALVTEQAILEDEIKTQTKRQQQLQRQSYELRTVCVYDTKRFPFGPVAVGNMLYILCKTTFAATAGPNFTVE